MITVVNVVFLVIFFCVVLRWFLVQLSVGNYSEKYVFITGCDTGFGNMLAKRLDKMGFHVFAACFTSKGADELEKESSKNLVVVSTLDVSKEESIEKAFRFVVDHLPHNKGLWAVVNNAGCSGKGVGPLEWHRRAVYLDVCAVNLFGVIDVTRIFLPLVRKGHGRIINMSSITARVGSVGIGPYVLSKFGIEGFSDCLRVELCKQGISVHIIEPGGFRTAFSDENLFCSVAQKCFDANSPEMKRFYGKHYLDQFFENIGKLKSVVSNDLYLVVDAYESAITSRFPRNRYNPGNVYASLTLLLAWFPSCISDWLISTAVSPPGGLDNKELLSAIINPKDHQFIQTNHL